MEDETLRSALASAANDVGDLAAACCDLIDCEGWAKHSDEALTTQQAHMRGVLKRTLEHLERWDDLRELAGDAR